MADKTELGFGIIGCGMISRFHAEAINAMKNGRLDCIYSRSADKGREFAEEFGCDWENDFSRFLARDSIDIVTIATPSGAHLEPTVEAAKARKHVICEKPLEVTLERVDLMIAACKENNVTLSGVFPRRFNESAQILHRAVEQGRLGPLTLASAYIKWWRTQEYYDGGDWRGTWELDGGGALMNQGIHTVDMLLWLGGDVESVCAFADRRGHDKIEVEDVATAIVKFRNGAHGVVEGSTACYHPDGNAAEVQLCGADGSVFMRGEHFDTWGLRDQTDEDAEMLKLWGPEAVKAGPATGAADPKAISFYQHQLNFEDAASAILAGKKPSIDGKEARRSIELILAIYESALNGGKKVDLPLKATPERRSFR